MNPDPAGSNHTLFYDTYALYAIAMGQPSYLSYTSNYRIFTTLMHLYELYYALLKDDQPALAEEFFTRLLSACIEITPNLIKQAAKFRYKWKKRNLSYVDCLGYVLAQDLNIPFLTGDNQFKDFSGVRFVK